MISDTGDDDNPYRYCGENYDEETGLYYLRARYYDASIGRFMSEDPAQDGLNWYVYCGNNPVMFVDPKGTHDIPLYNGDNIYDVRYDIRNLVDLVGGLIHFENGTLSIKALGHISYINVEELANAESGYRAEDSHYINGFLHYTMKEFLELIGANYSMQTVQMEITSNDVKYQRWSQNLGSAAMKLLEGSATSLLDATGAIGQAISSFIDVSGVSFEGNYNDILQEGFYKKQYIEIYDEYGKGIITNYILSNPSSKSSNNIGIYELNLWNADMSEMKWNSYWQYP
ncbi:MAG: RHS repeat-associated core domain-containing protein [Clostridia bacterium]|nr:RHS repeat-associated core domain-containing protein [Clostridia bacterium]